MRGPAAALAALAVLGGASAQTGLGGSGPGASTDPGAVTLTTTQQASSNAGYTTYRVRLDRPLSRLASTRLLSASSAGPPARG